MPRTFFDLNLLASIVAKLGIIVGEHVKFDMFANNVGQFGHTLIRPLCSRAIQLSQVKVVRELRENHLSRLLLARV